MRDIGGKSFGSVWVVAILAVACLLSCLAASAAQAAPVSVPAWSIQSLAAPTNFAPGDDSGNANYQVFATNSGGKATDRSAVTITDTLPAGLEVKDVSLFGPRGGNDLGSGCDLTTAAEVTTVSCQVSEAFDPVGEPARLQPGWQLLLVIYVTVPPEVSGTLVNRVEVEGGAAEPASLEAENQASAEDAAAGFEEFKAEVTGPDGKPAAAASAHPFQYATSFGVNLVPPAPGELSAAAVAGGDLREIEVELPPGLVGNPTALPRCRAQDFIAIRSVSTPWGLVKINDCPDASAVGLVAIQQKEGKGGTEIVPLYNLIPPKGMPAQFGSKVAGAPIYINTRLRSDGDYGITAYLHNVTQAERISAARVTVWGSPADPAHDAVRGRCAQLKEGSCPANLDPVRPFLRLPTSCQSPLLTGFAFETWAQPAASASTDWSQAAPSECELPDFSPTIEVDPTSDLADSPAGLDVAVHLPQAANEDPEGIGEADLKDAVVTLPPGLVVNPASADGLEGCSLAQIGYQGTEEGKPAFSAEPATCPNASKIGTARIHTPLLEEPLPGSVYLARQGENPFGSLLAIYIAVNDPASGVVVKMAGKVTPDPITGQLTTTVSQAPQLPFENFELDFFSGARAPLRTPATCGTHITTASLVPWSAPAGASAAPSDSFAIGRGPGGGGCPTGDFAPRLSAGMASPTAGAYSPFFLRLTRPDATDELSGVAVTVPEGLVANLSGVPYCSPAASDCPRASAVGTVSVGAGAGPLPYFIDGTVHLAGPYRGAPLSLLLKIPAVAGPFNLGTVVNRVALQVDPRSGQVSALADPLPRILNGIPLDIRDLRVSLDRPGFTRAPTSCDAAAIAADLRAAGGSAASLSERFQVGDCPRLAFKPRLSARLLGPTHRSGHPTLRTVLRPRPGDANLDRVALVLPKTELLDSRRIRKICTSAQYAIGACPAASIYGHARVWTPLLDHPLSGPVYLRASSGRLPQLVAALEGQVRLELRGSIDSVRGRLRITFKGLPDAPISKAVVSMEGGRSGLLVNTGGLCSRQHRVEGELLAHNAKKRESIAPLKLDCRG